VKSASFENPITEKMEISALPEIGNTRSENRIKSDVISIEKQLNTFEFTVNLTTGYDLFSKVNFVSKIV
jgi:hypothetical protein